MPGPIAGTGGRAATVPGWLALLVAMPCLAAEQASPTLPEGFSATVFHEGVGPARQIALAPSGVLYVNLKGPGLVALADADGDGQAERVEKFGDIAGTGVAVHDGFLYASSDAAVYRYALPTDGLAPQGEKELVVGGFPAQGAHAAKAFAFDREGRLYVNVGAPSNACQANDRAKGEKGQEPCPQLARQASIWRFPAGVMGLDQADGERIVTGTRNVLALASASSGELYFVMHGRDQLAQLWPDYYTAEDSAELPAEEMHRLVPGTDYGWPYTYWDGRERVRRLSPEYGGDGRKAAEAGRYAEPLVAFPAHWAPNAMAFYAGEAFPERYRGGAFVAFHGSWNRAPLPQAGFLVAFVPFAGGAPVGTFEIFADGFAERDGMLARPGQAEHRPMGVATAPDGALFISDSVKGRIWRVTYGSAAR